jgi:hypothetical protein
MKKPNSSRKEQERVNVLSDPACSNSASSQSELSKPITRMEPKRTATGSMTGCIPEQERVLGREDQQQQGARTPVA